MPEIIHSFVLLAYAKLGNKLICCPQNGIRERWLNSTVLDKLSVPNPKELIEWAAELYNMSQNPQQQVNFIY